MKTNYILTIAGSDIFSGGGMQADLATFTQHDLFGFVAVTCLTALHQDEFQITPISADLVRAELESLADVPFSAIKIGLLPTPEIAEVVLEFVKAHSAIPLVLDPVLVFKENGDEQVSQMKEQLVKFLPYTQVITPNLLEANLLTGHTIYTEADLLEAAKELHALGVKQAVVKGGARLGLDEAVDAYYDQTGGQMIRKPLLSGNNNGAGCTFASAIASQLALGADGLAAVEKAKDYVYHAIESANDYGVVQGKLISK